MSAQGDRCLTSTMSTCGRSFPFGIHLIEYTPSFELEVYESNNLQTLQGQNGAWKILEAGTLVLTVLLG